MNQSLIGLSHLSDLSFSELGVVKIDKGWDEVGIKVVDSFSSGISRLRHFSKEGKHILILPGVYDILHAGHVIWIYEAYNYYLSKISSEFGGVSNDDIYVVVLVDSDPLARAEKVSLHKSYGGNEEFLRPIIHMERRMLSLANINIVDLVIPVHSPLEVNSLYKSFNFDITNAHNILAHMYKQKVISTYEYDDLEKRVMDYRYLIDSNIDTLKSDFSRYNFPKDIVEILFESSSEENLWNNFIWQMYITNSIFKGKGISRNGSLFRVVSKRDGYSNKTIFLMKLFGIGVDSIYEKYITSTTDIIGLANEKGYNLNDVIC